MTNKLELGNVELCYDNGIVDRVVIKGVEYGVIPDNVLLDMYDGKGEIYFIYLTLRKSDHHFYIGKCMVSRKHGKRARRHRIIGYFGSGSALVPRINELKAEARRLKIDVVNHIRTEFERYVICLANDMDALAALEKSIVDEQLFIDNPFCLNKIKGGNSLMKEMMDGYGRIMSMVGKKRFKTNPSSLEPLFNASNNYWNDPKNRQRQSEHCKTVWGRNGYREMMSEKRKKRLASAEARLQQSINAKKGWSNKSAEQRTADLERLAGIWRDESRHEEQSRKIAEKFCDEQWKSEWRVKLSASVATDGWKAKNRAHLDELHSRQRIAAEERKRNMVVELFDLAGALVKRLHGFDAIVEYVHEHLSNAKACSIYTSLLKHLNGRAKTLYGHTWRLVEQNGE